VNARIIKANFTASDDIDFVPGEDDVILLAPDITLSIYDGEWMFRFPDEPVADDQDTINIDLSTCGRTEIFIEVNEDINVSMDFLATATFLDVIRAYKVKTR
jgi:hypothetical protein